MLKIVYAINSMGRTWDYRIKIMVLFWMSLVGGKLCFMTLIPGHCSRCSGWRIGRRTNRSKAAAETNSKWEISAFNSSQTATYGTAVVVAQLVEWSLPTREVGRSNPGIGKKLSWIFVYCQLYWKDENKEKRGVDWPIFQKTVYLLTLISDGPKMEKLDY